MIYKTTNPTRFYFAFESRWHWSLIVNKNVISNFGIELLEDDSRNQISLYRSCPDWITENKLRAWLQCCRSRRWKNVKPCLKKEAVTSSLPSYLVLENTDQNPPLWFVSFWCYYIRIKHLSFKLFVRSPFIFPYAFPGYIKK